MGRWFLFRPDDVQPRCIMFHPMSNYSLICFWLLYPDPAISFSCGAPNRAGLYFKMVIQTFNWGISRYAFLTNGSFSHFCKQFPSLPQNYHSLLQLYFQYLPLIQSACLNFRLGTLMWRMVHIPFLLVLSSFLSIFILTMRRSVLWSFEELQVLHCGIVRQWDWLPAITSHL